MKVQKTWQKRQKLYPLLSIAFATAIAFGVCQFPLDSLEFFTYDLRMKFRPIHKTSGLISTVAIEPLTLKVLGHEPTIEEHQQVVANVLSAQPKVVIYLNDPSEIPGSIDQQKAFADFVATSGKFIYAVNDLPPIPGDGNIKLKAPFENIEVLAAPKTVDKNIFAKDGVTRRMILSADSQMTMHPLIVSRINGSANIANYRGVFEFIETQQSFIDFRPTGTYTAQRFIDILQSPIDLASFKDKIVIIGRDTLETSQDYLSTPLSKDIVAMSLIEMHANAFDTLLLNSSPYRVHKWINLALTLLISIFTLYVVITLRPARGLLALALTVTGFLLLAYLLFAGFGIWISVAHPMLALFICYYFFIPYRLIVENRRSWEYLQKNKLLTQVEELKSNFLRMMSHDLKTPLARIQGMANIVLGDANTLSDGQRLAMSHIIESADELSDFIGSILNLGRIESKEIKLNLKSRDLNSLLLEVINKLSFLANKKNIQIITELEPIFSIKVDEDLLRQVFTNLIENAIKYSPENTKILVTTEELNGKLMIQVADQGIGIREDELENIFSKFYRSREVKNTEIPGSGLGLYLARYFVELHNGRMNVESQPQKGSTFSIELPMELNS